MCGIFGAIAFDRQFRSADYDRFVELTDLVRYRGPDDSGYLALNLAERRHSERDRFDVFLGHRRLSIIDLSEQGRQPMGSADRYFITYNGEIFNYIELREELQRLGHVFTTSTDTEVILKVYEEYGSAGFAKLNGMWAFALVDLLKGTVVLSRDRFSIKPLYYFKVDRNLFFASEIKQLLPLMHSRSIDTGVMHTYLNQAVADHSECTFFEGVKQVPPKHDLVIHPPKPHISREQYWDYSCEPISRSADCVEEFRELFTDSVRIRLRSDVEVGALLSGGLDSSTIAVVANKLLGRELRTWSIVGSDPRYSEERFIRLIHDEGIPNSIVHFAGDSALDAVANVLYHNDEPFLGFHAVAHFQMLQALRGESDIKVILSGQGGDECLCGYSKFFYFYLAQLLSERRVGQAAMLTLMSLLRRTTVWQFRLSEAQRYLPRRRPLQAAYLRSSADPVQIGRSSSLRDRQQRDLDFFSVPVQTHFEDRNSMAHSLEIRTPFLDHRLVDLCLSLPDTLKLSDGWSKYILRAAFPEVPQAVRWRRDKQGFVTPEESWLRHDFRAEIERRFASGRSFLGRLGIIDEKAFLAHYDRFVRGDARIWYAEISRVLLADIWAERFGLDDAHPLPIAPPTVAACA